MKIYYFYIFYIFFSVPEIVATCNYLNTRYYISSIYGKREPRCFFFFNFNIADKLWTVIFEDNRRGVGIVTSYNQASEGAME